MQGGQRAAAQTLVVNHQRYQLLSSLDEVVRGLPSGLRRSWTWEPIELQNVDVSREAEIAIRSFERGYGFTFANEDGVYEGPGVEASSAFPNGYVPRVAWDAGQDGVSTWAINGEVSGFGDAWGYRGWLKPLGDSIWLIKGPGGDRVLKEPISFLEAQQLMAATDTLDLTTVDANAIVASEPIEYGGYLYIPLKLSTTGAADCFLQMDDVGTLVAPSPEINAIAFATYQHPITGPVLAKAEGNEVSLNGGDPMTSTDWGPGYEVGDASVSIQALGVYGDDLLVFKEDGSMWLFDAQGVARRVTAVQGAGTPGEGMNSRTWFGRQYIPTANGLVEWRPGASRTVGAEQDRALDARHSPGLVRVMGMVPHGDRLYFVGWDPYRREGVLGSFSPGARSDKMPLTPHLHFVSPTILEDVTKYKDPYAPAAPRDFQTFDDNSAVGTIAWSSPENAEDADGVEASASAGISHYLRALKISPTQIPSDATITGLVVRVVKRKVASDIEYVGAGPVASANGSGSIVITTHADVATNDFLLMNVTSSRSVNTPSGWTALFNSGSQYWFWRISGGGAASYTVTTSSSAIALGGQIAAYRNVDTADPIGVSGSEVTGASSARLTLPTVATVFDREMVLAFHHGVGSATFVDSVPAPGVWTSGLAVAFRSGFGYASSVSHQLAGSLGASYADYTVGFSTAPGTTHSARFITLNPANQSDVTDNQVRLVKAGVISGTDQATATQWPTEAQAVSYGSPTSLWGTTITPTDLASSTFGIAISADVASGSARIDQVQCVVYYTLTDSEDAPERLAVLGSSDDGSVPDVFIMDLPRLGLTPAQDPRVEHRIRLRTSPFRTSRYAAPGFEITKAYRAVEFWLESEQFVEDALELQVWASVDDGDEFQLLGAESGGLQSPASFRETGFCRAFFPAATSSVGKYVQLVFRPTAQFQYPASWHIRDVKIRLAYRVESGRMHTFVVRLDEGTRFADGQERRTIPQQIADLEALRNPDAGDGAPIDIRLPDGSAVHGEIVSVQASEVDFKGQNANVVPGWVAVVRIREAAYS